ncbi:glycoside hydrolase family 55 protein, partial [Burkholderia pseudomallei]
TTTATTATTNLQFQSIGANSVARSLRDKVADVINAADFGVKCDGSTDDTAAYNHAISYAAAVTPSIVKRPNSLTGCVISGTINLPSGVTLDGSPGESGGFIAGANNLNPMIHATGNGAAIRNLYINAGAAGTNTSGTMIAIDNVVGAIVDNVYIQSPFIGLDVNGNQTLVTQTIVNNICGSGSVGLRIGNATTFAASTDVRLRGVTTISCTSTPEDAGMLILDGGGTIIESSDNLFAKVGTKIFPGTNQRVLWTSFSNTYVGDTNSQYGLVVDTNASGTQVFGTQCTSCWTSSATTANILIQNTGGGSVAALHFLGLRNYNSAGNGATINAGSDITFDASHFCGNGTGSSNIFFGGTVVGFAFRNSESGASCGMSSFTSTPIYGILFGATVSNVVLTGNDLSGPTNAIGGAPAGNSVSAENIGLDTGPGTVASAATISIGMSSVTQVSGTTGISTINPTWNGRTIRLITTGGAIAFSTGGNICAAFTSTQNVPVYGYYNGSCWYLK